MKNLDPLLKIKNLNVAFSSNPRKEIIHDVSLEVFAGEMTALVGASGSGKSITALSILQLLPSRAIASGEIWLEGVPIHGMNEKEMRKIRGKEIGMIFQDPMISLNPTMKIGKQIAEVLIHHEKLSSKAAKAEVLNLLNEVDIKSPIERFEAYPFQLSGGMRQRVSIAMALACRPKLLIADEPTTALDRILQVQILDLLKKIKEKSKMGILLITHDMEVILQHSDRIFTMPSRVSNE